MTVLLFGASGYLGRAAGEELHARGARVLRVSRTVPGEDGWVRHDLVRSSSGELVGLLRSVRPDVVVNCTGLLDGTTSELVTANVTPTAALLDAIPQAVPRARLVVLGSAAEYGRVREGSAVAEDAAANPVSAYGITKLASTLLVRDAVAAGRLDAVVLRIFNPIGPDLPAGTVLGRAAEAIRAAMREEDDITLGPLGSYRDFVDVTDVASAIADAALAPGLGEPVLNVGSGQAVAVRQVVAMLAEVAGFRGRVRETAPVQSRSGAVTWIAADTSRAHRALGWSPHHDLADSVRSLWQHS
ncbi:nucleoside-diphosphate-sugar epimerase [Lentzea atacamensis]|uniref:Nucleoside-diphosphate-sugar epimerase n=1 Tax=Lentzea atacamensis TaxID=531938 RepID=A0ABX9EJD2_9PSEU|nr:NAD(P)-dependent oxidoreductase [Lentzea atacamensis]RAS71302.1 nucleoside-diphosphate-sugar epimerase [Lentzea atacamensis]